MRREWDKRIWRLGVGNSFRTFGCGGLNTDEGAGEGGRTAGWGWGAAVVFKDGSHPK